MGVGRKPWDQQPDESNAAYARFLAYRNLGPTRSIEKAYQETIRNGTKQTKSNHQWKADSTRHNWRDRATAWDVDRLLSQGERTATLYMAAVEKYVERLYTSLAEQEIAPDDFDSLTKSIELLHKLLPGETIAAIIAANDERRATGSE